MITIMATSVKLHPPTIEERRRLDEDLMEIEEKLQGIIVLMRACYGKNSNAAIRADEIAGAIQRLKWELERVQQKTRAAKRLRRCGQYARWSFRKGGFCVPVSFCSVPLKEPLIRFPDPWIAASSISPGVFPLPSSTAVVGLFASRQTFPGRGSLSQSHPARSEVA